MPILNKLLFANQIIFTSGLHVDQISPKLDQSFLSPSSFCQRGTEVCVFAGHITVHSATARSTPKLNIVCVCLLICR